MKYNYFPVVIFIFSFINSSLSSVTTEVRCAVCRSLIVELRDAHLKEYNKRKKLQQNIENLAFEIHMIELYESICKSFDDYAQARSKKSGKLEALKMIVGGSMNPRMADYNLIQDPDLNKGLAENCMSILEDFEDEIKEFVLENHDTDDEVIKDLFCENMTDICPTDGSFDISEDLPFVNLNQDFSAPPPGAVPRPTESHDEEQEEGKEEL